MMRGHCCLAGKACFPFPVINKNKTNAKDGDNQMKKKLAHLIVPEPVNSF